MCAHMPQYLSRGQKQLATVCPLLLPLGTRESNSGHQALQHESETQLCSCHPVCLVFAYCGWTLGFFSFLCVSSWATQCFPGHPTCFCDSMECLPLKALLQKVLLSSHFHAWCGQNRTLHVILYFSTPYFFKRPSHQIWSSLFCLFLVLLHFALFPGMRTHACLLHGHWRFALMSSFLYYEFFHWMNHFPSHHPWFTSITWIFCAWAHFFPALLE